MTYRTKRPPTRLEYKGKVLIRCYFDGCCEPVNPGGTAAYGAVVYEDGKRVWECSEVFYPVKGKEKKTSNNVAEYLGFKAILEYLHDTYFDNTPIIVFSDSQLVVNQMDGDWKIRRGLYVPHALDCKKLRSLFKKMKVQWIPREQNTIADELSKRELKKAGVEFRLQPED